MWPPVLVAYRREVGYVCPGPSCFAVQPAALERPGRALLLALSPAALRLSLGDIVPQQAASGTAGSVAVTPLPVPSRPSSPAMSTELEPGPFTRPRLCPIPSGLTTSRMRVITSERKASSDAGNSTTLDPSYAFKCSCSSPISSSVRKSGLND